MGVNQEKRQDMILNVPGGREFPAGTDLESTLSWEHGGLEPVDGQVQGPRKGSALKF